ncbi:PEP-CTERM sorting domain-containing protein [Colwellia sp. C1TZA3]|nr:PEP-CTERM sorting domain-containing protein [Colwellia sp. C1TZA3]TWX72823.1 PEP-CTERM sorting domain-containing protein [Colwellia sp. C1TZA3]
MATIKAWNTLATAVPEPETFGLFSLLLCFIGLGKYKKQSAIVLS